ncbi:MAG: fluoride efflux transporter CrcB [Candidatus Marinimicrobia bacterium]|nr:fluoride efflux transporter CrcB [Candidatus Neomarinimicrobiota bacterium]MCF7829989.1 fluoride efflux transporter CrcB [Candidatus Neomarinimicrobiota bacterium]MCF7881857.1 fluoride efflux transporter CrcB [Candidatus Neomarinimicrobiota bacterium]
MNFLLVGIGGFFGAVSRYAVGGWVHRWLDNPWFPYGTLAVNVLGCFLIGFLAGMAETREILTPEMRLLTMVGFLGGFTTFSSFGYESIELLRDGQLLGMMWNLAFHLVLGLPAVWIGLNLTR